MTCYPQHSPLSLQHGTLVVIMTWHHVPCEGRVIVHGCHGAIISSIVGCIHVPVAIVTCNTYMCIVLAYLAVLTVRWVDYASVTLIMLMRCYTCMAGIFVFLKLIKSIVLNSNTAPYSVYINTI